MIRTPAVAGQFYRASHDALNDEVSRYIQENTTQVEAIGIVSPHAGFMYSGHVAGAVYSRIVVPEVAILVGPNHTGLGAPVSIMSSGKWEVPNGSFEIDEILARKIITYAEGLLVSDEKAHIYEHSLEVQLPFLAYLTNSLKIVPITFMRLPLEECIQIAEAIAKAVEETDVSVTIIASTDMSHYVSDAEARNLDNMAIEKILKLDPEGLYETVENYRITMCGYIPTTVMLHAAKVLGATRAELVKYATSAEVSGDYNHVVGYAGIIIR